MSNVSPVNVHRVGNIAVLTLDDGKVNALNASTLPALVNSLPSLTSADAVVFTGRPGMFCPGFDLKALPKMAPAERQEVVRLFSDFTMGLYLFPRPVVVALSGHALAGGAVFSLTGDSRLMAAGPYQFGFTEVAVGVALPGFVVELGQAAMSPASAVDLLLHARRLSPDEAARQGLVEVVEAPVLLDPAVARATELAKLPAAAYQLTKERLRGALAARWRETAAADVERLATLLGAASMGPGRTP